MARLTEEDIDRGIQADYDNFFLSQYEEALPENTPALFRKAMMKVVAKNYNLPMDFLKQALSKRADEYTIGEAGLVLNIITDVPFELLYDSLEEAIAASEEIVSKMIAYNNHKLKFDEKMSRKRASQMQFLQGTTRLSPVR